MDVSVPLHRLQFIYIIVCRSGMPCHRCFWPEKAFFLVVNSSNRRPRRLVARHRPSCLTSLLSWRSHANRDIVKQRHGSYEHVFLHCSPHVYLAARVVGSRGARERYPSYEIDAIPCLGGYLASVPMPVDVPPIFLYLFPHTREARRRGQSPAEGIRHRKIALLR